MDSVASLLQIADELCTLIRENLLGYTTKASATVIVEMFLSGTAFGYLVA